MREAIVLPRYGEFDDLLAIVSRLTVHSSERSTSVRSANDPTAKLPEPPTHTPGAALIASTSRGNESSPSLTSSVYIAGNAVS